MDSTETKLESGQRRVGRKLFLGALGLGAAGIASGAALDPLIKVLKSASEPGGVVPGFTIYTSGPIPDFHPATWRLDVDGLVERPLSLTYRDLLSLPAISAVRLYQCVTGWTVSNCHWEGVSLQTLARMAGARASARFINFYSADGAYTESLRLPSQAFKPDVMLGYKLDGRPLVREQGAPLRLVVPEMYGYKYIKWVNKVDFSDQPLDGYWEQQGYPTDAYIGTVS